MVSVFPNSGRLSSKGKGTETRPKKGVLPGKLGAGRDSFQNPHPGPDQLLGAAGVAARSPCLPAVSEAGVGRRGRLWAMCAGGKLKPRQAAGFRYRARTGLWNPRALPPAAQQPGSALGAWFSKTPSLPQLSHNSGPHPFWKAALLPKPQFPLPRRCVCVYGGRGTGRGGSAAGFPTGKQPNPSPGLFETLNRNRRQDAPGREAAPARISLPGGAAMTHPAPPSPGFLVCISPPGHVAAGAATHHPYPDTPAAEALAHNPGPLLPPWGFSGLWLAPALLPRRPDSTPCPCPPPCLRPPPPSGREPPPRPLSPTRGGKGAGSAGGVTAPARTTASCSLASAPGASWLIRLGRRRRLGAPCRWGGVPPPRPLPSTHPKGAPPPSPLP